MKNYSTILDCDLLIACHRLFTSNLLVNNRASAAVFNSPTLNKIATQLIARSARVLQNTLTFVISMRTLINIHTHAHQKANKQQHQRKKTVRKRK